ncbi:DETOXIFICATION 7 protein [Nymphaea thermarum]|nr:DETOXIFICATION 7 protein [Nymphaea thermarum]
MYLQQIRSTSTFDLSLEWWAFEIMILMSGLLPNAELEISVLSITKERDLPSWLTPSKEKGKKKAKKRRGEGRQEGKRKKSAVVGLGSRVGSSVERESEENKGKKRRTYGCVSNSERRSENAANNVLCFATAIVFPAGKMPHQNREIQNGRKEGHHTAREIQRQGDAIQPASETTLSKIYVIRAPQSKREGGKEHQQRSGDGQGGNGGAATVGAAYGVTVGRVAGEEELRVLFERGRAAGEGDGMRKEKVSGRG